MAEWFVRETFFRPAERRREDWGIPTHLYHPCLRLLDRSPSGCVFIPIRSMQYQAVIDRQEFIFVDSQGGYAQIDGIGGRLIQLAWQPLPRAPLTRLGDPIPCQIVHYLDHPREFLWRLVSEFGGALAQIERRYQDREIPPEGARILPFVHT